MLMARAQGGWIFGARRARSGNRVGRNMVYYQLLSALRRPECPLCCLRNESVHRYLGNALYDSVNDPSLRPAMDRARRFYREHAWVAGRLGDSLGVGIMYKDHVGLAQAAVQDVLRSVSAERRHGRTDNRVRGMGQLLGWSIITDRRGLTPHGQHSS